MDLQLLDDSIVKTTGLGASDLKIHITNANRDHLYHPNDPISGYIAFPTHDANADFFASHLTITLSCNVVTAIDKVYHGPIRVRDFRAKVSTASAWHFEKMYAQDIKLISPTTNTDQGETPIVRGRDHSWPFTFVIPATALSQEESPLPAYTATNDTAAPAAYGNSDTSAAALSHGATPLPPSIRVALCVHHGAVVEYVLEASLGLQPASANENKLIPLEAREEFKYAPASMANPPIDVIDFVTAKTLVSSSALAPNGGSSRSSLFRRIAGKSSEGPQVEVRLRARIDPHVSSGRLLEGSVQLEVYAADGVDVNFPLAKIRLKSLSMERTAKFHGDKNAASKKDGPDEVETSLDFELRPSTGLSGKIKAVTQSRKGGVADGDDMPIAVYPFRFEAPLSSPGLIPSFDTGYFSCSYKISMATEAEFCGEKVVLQKKLANVYINASTADY
ncbi:hypothetical protein P152DRAFT_473913 [Eremomyces bilateralis CBS 781.70]|uniref:Uncharacterized protein n=1 Tax=Eremomyces bilateralis CBS 781.70 TaxID=1392243 RepID=A0A6G1G2N8_9PEZI|nr:uncharacterized protein P152DRAFT_473913 [Eremomyces bilateralis CBS 781.70]KAF1812191.1 hypothetical protein P152DRAFT_473913 [Eremomyces bilateralis CBS 781.70]